MLTNENMLLLAEHLDDVMEVLEVEGVRRVNVVSMFLGASSVSAFCVRLLLAEKRQDLGFPTSPQSRSRATKECAREDVRDKHVLLGLGSVAPPSW